MRGGVDSRFDNDPESKRSTHKLMPVHRLMHFQVCRDYHVGDPRSLTFSEIRYFYNGMRLELHERTRAK